MPQRASTIKRPPPLDNQAAAAAGQSSGRRRWTIKRPPPLDNQAAAATINAMPESCLFAADEAVTAGLAGRLARHTRAGDALLLSGPLGAGKTAFARAFIRAASGDPALPVPSPSFTLVQTYDTPAGTIWHYDLWRVGGPEALEELAWNEARAGIVLVEWPDRLGPLTPAGALHILISPTSAGREIILRGEQRWLDAS